MALIDLARLMNAMEHIRFFDISVSSETNTLQLIMNEKRMEMSRFPQISRAKHQLESLEWNYEKTRSGYFPSLSLGGSVGSNYYRHSGLDNSPFAEQLKNNRQTYIYVALRIPLFDKFTTRNNLRAVKMDIQNQSFALQEVENNLLAEVLKIDCDVMNAQQKVRAANQPVT